MVTFFFSGISSKKMRKKRILELAIVFFFMWSFLAQFHRNHENHENRFKSCENSVSHFMNIQVTDVDFFPLWGKKLFPSNFVLTSKSIFGSALLATSLITRLERLCCWPRERKLIVGSEQKKWCPDLRSSRQDDKIPRAMKILR